MEFKGVFQWEYYKAHNSCLCPFQDDDVEDNHDDHGDHNDFEWWRRYNYGGGDGGDDGNDDNGDHDDEDHDDDDDCGGVSSSSQPQMIEYWILNTYINCRWLI